MQQRIIKFRAWDKAKKVFIPNDVYALINTDFGSFGVMIKDWEDYREGEYFYDNAQAISFFIGLHDNNGIEVYEGDVVNVKIYKEYDYNGFGEYEVVFKAPEFQLKAIRFSDSLKGLFGPGKIFNNEFRSIWKNDNFEIIGNIYEHPNLLNDGI